MSEEDDLPDDEHQRLISDTDAFLNLFTSKHGPDYKLCPKEWLITDWGFGVDITCCQGDCHPVGMRDIRKITNGANDKECFLNWAQLVGKSINGRQLDEIPQVAERVKIRQVIREHRQLEKKLKQQNSQGCRDEIANKVQEEFSQAVQSQIYDLEARLSKQIQSTFEQLSNHKKPSKIVSKQSAVHVNLQLNVLDRLPVNRQVSITQQKQTLNIVLLKSCVQEPDYHKNYQKVVDYSPNSQSQSSEPLSRHLKRQRACSNGTVSEMTSHQDQSPIKVAKTGGNTMRQSPLESEQGKRKKVKVVDLPTPAQSSSKKRHLKEKQKN